MESTNAALHDAYAEAYDEQVQVYDCHIHEVLFGLCYEYAQPGQRLLDVGIGSGLSSALFAKAGLEIHGMDFSPAMLQVCRAKRFAADLKLHDVAHTPWPYPSGGFDHVTCCGVFHFLEDLAPLLAEARRVLRQGTFSFTTRLSSTSLQEGQPYERQRSGSFDIFSHAPAHIDALIEQHTFHRLKTQRCYVGDDLFMVWVVS